MKKNNFKDIINIPMSLINKLVPKRDINFITQFNAPFKYLRGALYVNERIIEQPYALNSIDINGKGKRLLDFGCTRSYMSLQCASLGYEVVGIDLRKYNLTHPNFQFYQKDILELNDTTGFNYIIAVSVLEHVGLGFYGKKKNASDLEKITLKLAQLLRNGGSLIITVPIGKKYEDKFLRSFSHEEIYSLFKKFNLELIKYNFYKRTIFKIWEECDLEDTRLISNSAKDRGPTGVNGVGCYIWKKT